MLNMPRAQHERIEKGDIKRTENAARAYFERIKNMKDVFQT